MNLDDVMSWLEAASLLAGLVPVVLAVLAARRRPRLRREEEMWRHILEARPDLAPIKELHQRAAAQLIAQHVTDRAARGARFFIVLGGVLAGAGGLLGATLAADIDQTRQHPWALLTAVGVLGGGGMLLWLGLDEITGERDGRHRAARQILGDTPDPSSTAGHRRWWWLTVLSLGAMVIVAGLSGTFWALGWTFVKGMPYPVISWVSLLVYLFGSWMWGKTWRRLVTRPPDPPPIPEPDELDCPVPVDSDVDAGPPVGAGCPPRQQGVPMWRLVLGTALGTAAGHVLSRRRT